MKSKPKIYIYGLCNVYYESFYIQGLKEYFGVKNVFFNISKFPKFGIYDAMSIIIKYENHEIKICIDSNDRNEIIKQQLDWCDIYGKINYNETVFPQDNNHKIKAIGPSFGIKIWNFPTTCFIATLNFIRFYRSIPLKKYFLSNYKAQYKRLPLHNYLQNVDRKKRANNFIFFIGSIWKQEPKTNELRSNFIKCCKKNKSINFEGGFAPRSDGNNLTYQDIVLDKPYTLKHYLYKTKLSSVAFNTPAVNDCHGWKLGEFLAMGKAILSTPFYNKMPIDLINNENIIFLNSCDEIDINEKLQTILKNKALQLKLEQNSRQYFLENLAPEKVISRLLN